MSGNQEFLPSRQGEEHLKINAFGGVARSRSAGAFTSLAPESNAMLHQLLQKDVFQPSEEDLLALNDRIRNYLASDRIKVLIPMRELQANSAPIIDETIDVLADYVGIENIFIVNNGLHETIKEILLSKGISLISADKMKKRFYFSKLLEILSLQDLDFGLGFSMMSGIAYLAVENLMQPDDWLVKFDGDIVNFKQCLLPEYLFYPVVREPKIEWDYLKIAKVGRNNETIIAGINSLTPYFHNKIEGKTWEFMPQALAAREIYEACIHQLWILSGQYAIRWQHVEKQLATTGYCNPLLVSAQQGWRNLAQIIHPHPLLDMPNTKRKEDCMMSHLVQFIHALVVFGKSIRSQWNIEEVACFNRDIAQHQTAIVWIPEEPSPLRLASIEPDRLFPSLEAIGRILLTSSSVFWERLIRQLGIAINVVILTFLGQIAISIFEVISSFENFIESCANGFSIAAAVIVAQSLGAKKTEIAVSSSRISMVFVVSLSALCAGAFFLFPNQLFSIFLPKEPINTVSIHSFYIAAIEQLFMAVSVFMTQVLQIRGDTQTVTLISLIGWLIVRFSAIYLFVFVLNLGLVGFWLGLTCDWFVRTLALGVLFFHQQRWQEAGE